MPLSARAAFTEARELLRLFVQSGRPEVKGACAYCHERSLYCKDDCLYQRAVRLVASMSRK